MTDQQMDERLRAAAARWRATGDAVPEPIETHVEVVPVVAASSRRPRRTWLVAAAAVAAVAAAAVVGISLGGGNGSPQAAGKASALYGVVWRFSGYDVNGLTHPPRDGASGLHDPVRLIFDGKGHVSGIDGCNSLSGRAHVDGTRITYGDLVVSLKACLGSQVEAMQMVMRIFTTGTVTWSVANGRLTLSNSRGEIDFRAAGPAPTYPAPSTTGPLPPLTSPPFTPQPSVSGQSALVGVTWHLALIRQGSFAPVDGKPRVAKLVYRGTTFRIGSDGTYSARYVCGGEGGNITVTPRTLVLMQEPDRNIGCTSERKTPIVSRAMKISSRGISLMTTPMRWHISGNVLTLTRGSTTLVFSR